MKIGKRTAILLIATILLAVIALFTAWRLYDLRQEPVAPTAPERVPAAEPAACAPQTFTITDSGCSVNPSCCKQPSTACTNTNQCGSGFICYLGYCVQQTYDEKTNTCPASTTTTPTGSGGEGDPITPVSGGVTATSPSPTAVTSPSPTVTPTTSPTQTSTAAPQTGGGGSSTQGPSAPASCSSTKPGSAPTITSAKPGTNSVTLTWTKAQDPVTHYYVVYGTSAGKEQYGSPNIGNKDTTTYTVRNLSGGTTYYFRIAAVNNCMPGNYSNEVSAKPSGSAVTGPATSFKALNTTPSPSSKAELPQAGTSTPVIAAVASGILILVVGILLAF